MHVGGRGADQLRGATRGADQLRGRGGGRTSYEDLPSWRRVGWVGVEGWGLRAGSGDRAGLKAGGSGPTGKGEVVVEVGGGPGRNSYDDWGLEWGGVGVGGKRGGGQVEERDDGRPASQAARTVPFGGMPSTRLRHLACLRAAGLAAARAAMGVRTARRRRVLLSAAPLGGHAPAGAGGGCSERAERRPGARLADGRGGRGRGGGGGGCTSLRWTAGSAAQSAVRRSRCSTTPPRGRPGTRGWR